MVSLLLNLHIPHFSSACTHVALLYVWLLAMWAATAVVLCTRCLNHSTSACLLFCQRSPIIIPSRLQACHALRCTPATSFYMAEAMVVATTCGHQTKSCTI
jgi:hypothetical protein